MDESDLNIVKENLCLLINESFSPDIIIDFFYKNRSIAWTLYMKPIK